MKKFSMLVFVIGLGLIISGCSSTKVNSNPVQSETGKDKSDQAEKIVMMIKNDSLFINNNKIALPWEIDKIQKLIDKHDRVFNGANNIYTYDKKGIYFYEAPDHKNEVTYLYLLYGKGEYKFSPEETFKGECIINGIKVSETTTADNVLKQFKKFKPQKQEFGYGYSMILGNTTVSFYFNKSDSLLREVTIMRKHEATKVNFKINLIN